MVRLLSRLTCLLGALLGFASGLITHAVEPGMARVNVLQELGRPVSAIARGNTEVLTYKDGLKITLQDGRVSTITGQQATAPAEPTVPLAKAETETAEPTVTKEEQAKLALEEKRMEEAAAKSRAEFEKSVADLENLHQQPAAALSETKLDIGNFLAGLLLKCGLTLVALKLTCKYWGVTIFWSGLLTVAAVDVAVRAIISGLGIFLLKMPSVFYADEATAAIIMVLVLRKVSVNQSLAQAVQITMTTKVFSIVVGSFLFTLLMSALN